ncbi:MAG: alpha/beta fold hydrolase [Bacteroidota bacterium]
MKPYLTLLLILFLQGTPFAQNNIEAYGIDETTLQKEYAEWSKYRSQINYPPFIGWSLNGRKMLFNGGKVLYAMKNHQSEIRDYNKAGRNFSTYLSPNQEYFLYQEDSDGDENYELFLYHIAKKESIPLSEKGDKTYDPFWCPDNEKIAYKSNQKDPAVVDLYIRDPFDANQEKLIFKDLTDDGQVYDWSAEKHLLLVVKVISENDKLLYLINEETHAISQVNPSQGAIAYSAAKFIPNQAGCLIVSDEFSEFLQLHHYDLINKKFTTITTDIPWDVEAISIDAEGEKAAFSVNENGLSQLYILDVPTLSYIKVNDFPEGIIRNLAINPQGTEVGFNFYSSTFRRKIYGYDLEQSTLNQYNRKGKMQTDSIAFIKAESFTFQSIDQQTNKAYQIPAFIYRSQEKESPVLIDIHGGPEYQIRASFNGFYQYLVNELGITVIVPNIRGSNGYGKSYMKMDDGLNRENAIDDIGALLDWVENEENLDANRMALHGESYGGYAVLASLAKFPNRIKCGIDIVGISNWISYLDKTSDYRRDLRRVEFGDERDTETYQYLQRISPRNNVDKINAPLLLFQGLNDPRVNYQESEQLYESLNAKGNEVWYVLAKDEGHGFQKYPNYLLQRYLTISFLKKHLSIEF